MQSLEETVEKLRGELQNSDQLKGIYLSLEAQLNKHLEAGRPACQNYTPEVEVLRPLLLECLNLKLRELVARQKRRKELTRLTNQYEAS